MVLRFLTSIATDRGSYMVGQRITVAKPTAEHMRWLNQGIVVAERSEPEAAVSVPLRRTGRTSRGSVPARRLPASGADQA